MKSFTVVITVPAVCIALSLGAHQAFAETQAQQCVASAKELQQIFDHSIVKGWQLRFFARGEDCDVLHVEARTNLEKRTLEAVANGTQIFGKALPGGVNRYAFSHGFSDTVYSTTKNARNVGYGPRKLNKETVKQLRKCTKGSAGKTT